jgi:hypothetical protein
MSVWRVVYDYRWPYGAAFGRMCFVEAEDDASARRLGRRAAQSETDAYMRGAKAEMITVMPSTPEARAALDKKKAAYAAWQQRSSLGIPNRREDLA